MRDDVSRCSFFSVLRDGDQKRCKPGLEIEETRSSHGGLGLGRRGKIERMNGRLISVLGWWVDHAGSLSGGEMSLDLVLCETV